MLLSIFNKYRHSLPFSKDWRRKNCVNIFCPLLTLNPPKRYVQQIYLSLSQSWDRFLKYFMCCVWIFPDFSSNVCVDFVVRKKEEVVKTKKVDKTPAVVLVVFKMRGGGLEVRGKSKPNTPIFPNPLPLPMVKTTEETKSGFFGGCEETMNPVPRILVKS